MTDLTLWDIITGTSTFISLLLAGLVFVRWRRLDKTQYFLGILVIFAAVIEIFARILAAARTNNLPLLHIYTYFEFILLYIIFSFHIVPLRNKTLKWFSIILFGILVGTDAILRHKLFKFNDISRSVETLIIISFCITYFYALLKNLPNRYLERTPMFWINVGLLLYFSSSLFIFIFSNYVLNIEENTLMELEQLEVISGMTQSQIESLPPTERLDLFNRVKLSLTRKIWTVHAFSTIIKYIFFGIALSLKKEPWTK